MYGKTMYTKYTHAYTRSYAKKRDGDREREINIANCFVLLFRSHKEPHVSVWLRRESKQWNYIEIHCRLQDKFLFFSIKLDIVCIFVLLSIPIPFRLLFISEVKIGRQIDKTRNSEIKRIEHWIHSIWSLLTHTLTHTRRSYTYCLVHSDKSNLLLS